MVAYAFYPKDLHCVRTCLGCVIPLKAAVSVKQFERNSIRCQPPKTRFRCSSRIFASLSEDIRSSETISIRNDSDKAKKYRLPVTSKEEYASKPEEGHTSSFLDVLSKQLKALYLFSRPHTLIGTVSFKVLRLLI